MATKKILGLDLGVGSIGWALIEMEDDKASSILGMGSRIVPLTTDDSTQFSKGQAITKNADRTARRTARKGYDRYQLRRAKLTQVLRQHNMLPERMDEHVIDLWQLRADATTEGTTKTEETPKTEQSVDMQALMQQMQEMQKQIESLKKEKEEAENKNSDSENIIEALKKSLAQKGDSDYEKEIPVVSECNGVLVLSTDGYGQGTKYKFDKIGEMQNIPFGDLKEICKKVRKSQGTIN